MHWTQPSAIYCSCLHERRLPPDAHRFRGALFHEPSVPGLSVRPAMAQGLCMSAMRRHDGLVHEARPVLMQILPAAGVRHGGDSFSRHPSCPNAVDFLLVSRLPRAALRLPQAKLYCSFRANSANRITGNLYILKKKAKRHIRPTGPISPIGPIYMASWQRFRTRQAFPIFPRRRFRPPVLFPPTPDARSASTRHIPARSCGGGRRETVPGAAVRLRQA